MSDWIVAAATAPARSALAVVRISGTALAPLRDAVTTPLHPGPWRPGRTRRVALRDPDGVFDDGLAVFSAAPRSYTGQDTLELSLHGNPLLVERLLAACTRAGCRLAPPGAFTRRAVLNGKLSLLAAEAVDLTIRATSTQGLAIVRQVEALSAELAALRGALIQAMAELEARLDYPADELALESDAEVVEALGSIAARSRSLAATHRLGERLIEGATVALVGPVNVGKSSLFNALLGRQRALVHDGPGTTRDVVESRFRLQGLDVRLLDTAGERATDDPIEAAGQALAGDLIGEADLLLLVGRAGVEDPAFDRILARTADRPRIVVYNQVDRAPPGTEGISTVTGHGLDALRSQLAEALGANPGTDLILASARQAELCWTLDAACREGAEALGLAGVAVALDVLTEALEALDQLTGADSREDVLDALFARFCIGK